jgi:signal transduction histidine kinase
MQKTAAESESTPAITPSAVSGMDSNSKPLSSTRVTTSDTDASLAGIKTESVLPLSESTLTDPILSDVVCVEMMQTRIAELEASLEHRERQIHAMRRTSEALFQHISVDSMVRQTLNTALEVLGAEAGSLQLYDADSDSLVFRYVVGPACERLTGYVMPASQGIAGQVFRSGVPDLTEHVGQRADFNPDIDKVSGYHTESMMTVPVKRPEGNAIGVMQILNAHQPGFDNRDLEVLQVLCGQAAAAIETARLAQQARKAEIVNIIGDISHDIKNMLTPIQTGMWTLQPMVEQLFSDLDTVCEQCQGRRAAEDIRRVMSLMREDYSWIFQGALESCEQVQARTKEIADAIKGELAPPFFELCDLNETAQEVARPLNMVAESAGLHLILDLDENLPRAEFDRKQLYNALYNLINNAIPETPEGGTITLRTQAPQTGEVTFAVHVCDTGRGMPEYVRTRLFTDETVSTKPGGTGLGTRIVGAVVRRHNGTISVESAEGQGSTFTIRLPLKQTETAAA